MSNHLKILCVTPEHVDLVFESAARDNRRQREPADEIALLTRLPSLLALAGSDAGVLLRAHWSRSSAIMTIIQYVVLSCDEQ